MVTGRTGDEIDGLRRALAAGALERIAPHCTLVPPVNVHDEDLGTALDLVRSAAATGGPVGVVLGPPTSFLPVTPVLYLEVSGDDGELDALQRRLCTGPLAPPSSRPQRPFVPHVTLDQRIDPARADAALSALADYRVPYCFERVTVLEQVGDQRWVAIADAALGRPAVVGRGGLELELAVVDRPDPVTLAWANEVWARYSRAQYGDDVAATRPFAVIARAAGELVGVAEGELRGPVCRLARLMVPTELRSRGIGAQLLKAVERVAREHGCERVRLETGERGRAETFYADHGYVRTGTLPRWREEQDFVLMERSVREG